MSETIDVYFDVGSPASYLAWTQLPALADRNNASINWKPMLLGGVFKATDNQSPSTIPAKDATQESTFRVLPNNTTSRSKAIHTFR